MVAAATETTTTTTTTAAAAAAVAAAAAASIGAKLLHELQMLQQLLSMYEHLHFSVLSGNLLPFELT
jgi:hypothetical protein